MAHYLHGKYEYSKRRRNFGRQTVFQTVPGHILDNITPNPIQQKEYCLRNPVHREVQATAFQSEHEGNTPQIITTQSGVNHTEGGWPREIHPDNEEQVIRYRRHVLHEENYVHTVMSLAPAMKHYVDQNNAIEMYESYFKDMPAQEPVEKHNVKITNVFCDKERRQVSCLVWTNDKQPKLAVAYNYAKYPTETPDKFYDCFIWDVQQESEPVLKLRPDYVCWQLACCPVHTEVLAAGLENGIVSLFDIRESIRPVQASSIYNSHRGPITSLLYTHSRTNTEFFTGSPDGQCLFWDMRKLVVPTDRLIMSVRLGPKEQPSIPNAEGISALSFDRGFPTKFLAGTESGLIINVNRMGKNHAETMSSYWNAHNGPVRAVHRSPCTLRMFLSCGDWEVKIWSEEIRRAPIILTRPYQYQVSDAAWAPLRFSSYMAICEGGFLHYWDLLRRYHEPVLKLKVSDYPLKKIRPHNEGELIAIGDSVGEIHLIQMSENMSFPGPKDKTLMAHIYERETKREHILDARLREIHLKRRQEEDAALAPEPSVAAAEEDFDEFKMVEENYYETVQEVMKQFEAMSLSDSKPNLL